MLSNWWLTSLTWLEVVGQIAVLVLMVRIHAISRWPSVFAACSVNLVGYIALLAMTRPGQSYRLYFYSYWTLAGIQAAFRMWMTADIARSIPGIRIVPVRVGLLCWSLGAILACACAWITWQDRSSAKLPVIFAAVTRFDRSVNFAIVALFILMLFAITFLRFAWQQLTVRMAQAAAILVGGKILVSLIISFGSRPLRIAANGFESITYIAALTVWSVALARRIPLPSTVSQADRTSEAVAITTGFLDMIRSQRK